MKSPVHIQTLCVHIPWVLTKAVYPKCLLLQGLWVATTTQLARFMKSKLWNKSDALAFKMEPFVNGSWGYPERASSTAVFGGLVPVPQGRTSAPSSCMLPYIPASQGAPGQVSFQAHSDHLPNKYVQMGSGVKFENVTRGG